MTYGLRVDSSAGHVQLDSARGGDSAFVTVYSGTGNDPIGSYKSYLSNLGQSYGNSEIVMVNTTVSSGAFKFIALRKTASNQTNSRIYDYNGNLLSVNYIILERVIDLSNTFKNGTYGLQVFNDDNDEMFDSRYYQGNGGIEMLGYFPLFGITGNSQTGNANTDGYIYVSGGNTSNRITSNLSHYVMVSPMGSINTNAFDGIVAFNNFNITSGTNTNIFTGSTSSATNQVFSGYYPIRWRPNPPRSGGGSHFLLNNSDILYGDVI